MADTYSAEERRAIAAYAGPVQRVETRTPEEIIAAGYEVARGSSWGHDKQHPIKSGQDSARRRRKRLAKFERAAAVKTPKRRDPRKVAADAREQRIRELVEQGLSVRQIAEATGHSKDATRNFMYRRGIRSGWQG